MKQISLKEALAKLMMGQEVKILIPGAVADDWADYSPAYLSEYLDGVIFFADGAVPEQKEDLAEWVVDGSAEEKQEPKQEPADKKKRGPRSIRGRSWRCITRAGRSRRSLMRWTAAQPPSTGLSMNNKEETKYDDQYQCKHVGRT